MIECAAGHVEEVSHAEVYQRMVSDDWECREGECDKSCELLIDKKFWDRYFP